MIEKMFKKGLVIGIITLFIGMSFIPTVASIQPEAVDTIETISNEKFDGPGWKFFLFGRINNIEIFEYEGIKFFNATALHVRGIIWNVLPEFPNLPILVNLVWDEFCIPYEWVKIMAPFPLGQYFLIAEGTADIYLHLILK
jgi:hypothetical protein